MLNFYWLHWSSKRLDLALGNRLSPEKSHLEAPLSKAFDALALVFVSINIKLTSTDKVFSQFGGLYMAKKILEKFQIIHKLGNILPLLKSGIRRNQVKSEQLILGFLAGADCLDDMDRLALDPGIQKIFQERSYTAKSHGNFLRSFSALEIKSLTHNMCENAFVLRQQIQKKDSPFILDLDSTKNKQFGKKMEGYSPINKQAHGRYDRFWCRLG